MKRKTFLAAIGLLPLLVASWVYGQTLIERQPNGSDQVAGFTCPMTGENLPCPNCCPLNEPK